MIHQSSNHSNKSGGVLPIRRTPGATASSTLYPLHQTRSLALQLRPGSTSAPNNLSDACRLSDLLSGSSNHYLRGAPTATASNGSFDLVSILDDALSISQDTDSVTEPEEPCDSSPYSHNICNNNNNNRPYHRQ